MSAEPAAPLLEARGIEKRFPGVHALRGVDLVLRAGEIVSVVGENGAGKSTLMKVLAGIHAPDAGEVLVEGRPVLPGSVNSAAEAGIALVHQELDLCDNLDVGANVLLGREPRRLGLIDERAVRRRTDAILRELGADFDARTPVAALSMGRCQLVEIAKALSIETKVLVLDEPTSSLSEQESEQLFDVVRGLAARGVGVLYISHRLGEVRALSDRVVVLRDGALSGELAGEAIEHDAMVRLMVGRDVHVAHRGTRAAAGTPALELEGVATRAFPGARVSLAVAAGEKVGLAGLVGAGRSELLRAVFGVDPRPAGSVRVQGRSLRPGDPRAAIALGLGLVPEDRKGLGLFLEDSLAVNVGISALHRHRRHGLIEPGWQRGAAARAVRELGIRARDVDVEVGTLSGGNQQKVVLARWLELRPAVLLLDEPSRGVDVGARQEIYALLDRLTEEGVAVLFASSEMEEVLALADRVAVLHEGRLSGVLRREELSEEAVMTLATRETALAPEV